MNAQPARRRVTQKDVARHAGVSTSIVSYVINNGPRSVSAATRQRVLRAIEELNYRPNKYAQMLMRGPSKADQAVRQFGIIVGGDASVFTRPYYGAILSGIYAEAHRLHTRVRFLQFLDDLSDPVLFNELIHPEEVSGLLLFAFEADVPEEAGKAAARSEIMQRALRRIENVVCVERQWGGLPAVGFDREKAAHMAVSHLIGLGHRAIGYLGSADDRLTGYRNALYEHGLAYDPRLLPRLCGRNTPADGREQALDLMRRADPPSALFTCSDEVAFGAMGALHELGVHVPDEVAIASVDDIELACHCRPRLTSVSVPKAQMGSYAVRLLHERGSQRAEPAVSVVLPTALKVRESCGSRLPVLAAGD